MIDTSVRQLLEEAVDSTIKLQLLLLFHENPRLELSPQQAANRTYRDIWSTREALQELHQDGILALCERTDGPCYGYRPRADQIERITRLVLCFNEPMERDHIQRALREITLEAGYRRAKRQMRGAFELQSI